MGHGLRCATCCVSLLALVRNLSRHANLACARKLYHPSSMTLDGLVF
ncbi:hypothetical protein BLL52_2310 [Rhodoferax antarcticus ANT.BR]|uniref:Uncharacterized protein n=1 Tax=Rhodoferax antarcticus ANT.BR TaxID=1111071 RepID=A0A1Q8YE26_9BURK|nr:hypothetical protein BLL52_2310 [Rhodoferax antarcticus ANT.BR]